MNPAVKIIVAPLNWGLGHATRCIPVIRELLLRDAEVILASDGQPLQLLKKEFPNLKWYELPSYQIHYPASGRMALHMLRLLPRMLRAIHLERIRMEEIIKLEQPQAIISDNRYGCNSRHVHSVLLTHQLFIRCPPVLKMAEPVIHQFTRLLVSKFDNIWIPDFENTPNLSGELSHKKKFPDAQFVGPLSRFAMQDKPLQQQEDFDVIAVCSGPEPQRSVFEKLMTDQLLQSSARGMIVRGVVEEKQEFQQRSNLIIVNYLDSEQMQEHLQRSALLISRPGYSTLMDVVVLGCHAVFVPTLGQTEQEYLAGRLKKLNCFFSMPQNEFNLSEAMRQQKNFSGLRCSTDARLLQKAIASLMQSLK